MSRVSDLPIADEITLWAAATTVRQQWPRHGANPEKIEDLLTGDWAQQIQQSPTLRAATIALVAKDTQLVLLAVSAVRWVSPAQFRTMFLSVAQQTEALGFAPVLEHLWTRASRAQRAALSYEDLTACTQAQVSDIRLCVITTLLPALDARCPERHHSVAGTVTAWGTHLRTVVQRLTEKLRPSKGRSA